MGRVRKGSERESGNCFGKKDTVAVVIRNDGMHGEPKRRQPPYDRPAARLSRRPTNLRFQNSNGNLHFSRRGSDRVWSHRGEPIFTGKYGLREPHSSRQRLHHEGWVSLFIDNIHRETTVQELRSLFNKAGVVVDTYISSKKRSNKKTLFGFVRFRKHEEGDRAIRELHGRSLKGESLTVSWARFVKGHKNRVQKQTNTETERREKTIKTPAYRDERKYSEVVRGPKQQGEPSNVSKNQRAASSGLEKEDDTREARNRGHQNSKQGDKRDSRQVLFNISESPIMKERLENAVIVEYAPPVNAMKAVRSIKNMLLPSILFFSTISPLKIAIFFEDKNGVERALEDNSPLKQVFNTVYKWSENAIPVDRAVWLECSGLHPYYWSHENLRKIGDLWGKTIDVVDVFHGIHSISSAKILVLTKTMRKIEKKVTHEHGDIWVREIEHCACMDYGPLEDEDYGLEKSIYNGRELSHELERLEDTMVGLDDVDNLRDTVGCSEHDNEEVEKISHNNVDDLRQEDLRVEVGALPSIDECWARPNSCPVQQHWEERIDPMASIECTLLLGDGRQSGKAGGDNGTVEGSQARRPRGRPKRMASSLPDTLSVPTTPSLCPGETGETWHTARTLGIGCRRVNRVDAVHDELRRSRRIQVMEVGATASAR